MTADHSTQLPSRVKDERGNVYGKLTVLEYAGGKPAGRWLCRCECGNTITPFGRRLRSKTSRSCGCTRKTLSGRSHSPEHRTWEAMKTRCYNPNAHNYKHYGGRGITICGRWRKSFLAFLEDMGEKPFPEATIERVNNDGPYAAGNCRWASRLEQGQNTRKVRMLTHNRETMSISAWARKSGVSCATISDRLERGWSTARALTAPVRQNPTRHISYNGETLCLTDWAKRLGITRTALSMRIKWGWPKDRVFSSSKQH